MARKRVNKYPIAFRQMKLERMKNCASVSALAEELGVHRTVLYHWQRQQKAGCDGTPTSAMRRLRKEVRDVSLFLKSWIKFSPSKPGDEALSPR